MPHVIGWVDTFHVQLEEVHETAGCIGIGVMLHNLWLDFTPF